MGTEKAWRGCLGLEVAGGHSAHHLEKADAGEAPNTKGEKKGKEREWVPASTHPSQLKGR